MNFLKTKHERKSAFITSILLVLILFAVFNYGLQYLDPPQEYGLGINFGDANTGSGDPVENSKNIPAQKQPVQKQKEIPKEVETPKETATDKLVNHDRKETTVIEKVKEVEKPKPSKATQDALNNLLKGNSKDGENKGEGDDDNTGLKGDKNGDPKSTKYYGNNGSGGDKNYNLAGRNALSKPIEKPECNEEGVVVVIIEVDTAGKVIKATPGVKGSTNIAKCLLDPAKAAAMKTTWNADPNAPSKQRGTIIYRFSLSE
uniref:energy transducer TonB n=1 Tax=Polaribacter sp. TaxID=1920175 RepID=UPI0040480419